MSEEDEIVQAFLEESRENLEQLDRDLVDLENHPDDPALLAGIFRTIHTIKGTCGFLGYQHLEALTHAGESLLGALRAGELRLDAEITTSLLHLVDAVRAVLGRIEATGVEGVDDHAALIVRLGRHLEAATTDPPPNVDAPSIEPRPVDQATPSSEPVEPVAPNADQPGSNATESSVRVDVAVLDKLLDLVGELVLARTQIGEIAIEQEDGPLAAPYRQLRLVTSELQEGVMRARLQPVGNVIGKFRRIARDLATALDKHVQVELEGVDVGVDKAVNEALRDPLLHLVRNAVDHGIESTAERLAAGKQPEGRLRIHVYHEGGRVHVEVSDDGRGIDAERLRLRAVSAGMLSADAGAILTRSEALQLMFLPGLSTKDEVTAVSGRGVGMDVVKANLAQVGGSIDVSSITGEGSTFRINVPLTLAIMPAVIAWSGGGRYAVPEVDVREVLRLQPDEIAATVHDVGGARFYRLRGRLIPLVELAHCLEVAAVSSGEALTVVVVEVQGVRFGLIVDALGDTIEAVVKPLTQATRSIGVFAGVTIMADGRPSLIIDVAGVASRAGLDTRDDEDAALKPIVDDQADLSSLLLASSNDGGRIAVRLSNIRRLEQFGAERVERVGSMEVLQYDEGILPLVRVSDLLPGPAALDQRSSSLQAVVCDSSVGMVGLVVDHIEDIVSEPMLSSQRTTRPGVEACLIAGDCVTELIDVEALVAAAGVGPRR